MNESTQSPSTTSSGAGDGTEPAATGVIAVVLDTPNPTALARFYAALLGWPDPDVDAEGGDWVDLHGPDGWRLSFQRATDFTPPTWPDPAVPQQFHLDLRVTDQDAAETRAVALGARPVDGPDDNPDFRVYLDPSGHPFCLCV